MLQSERGSALDVARELWTRRKCVAILVFAAVLLPAVTVVRSLPNVYRATATVLVERQQVAETFVKPSVTGELETRLQTVSQEMLSRARLAELITRFDLYPRLRQRATLEAAVERLRRDIQIEIKAVDQTWGRGGTIAFALSHRGPDPLTVARVANALASFHVERSWRIREQQAMGTTQFLGAQLEDMARRLAEEERKVNEFKRRHTGQLPEQLPLNLAAIERLNMELRLNRDSQMRAQERRADLARQAAAPTESPGPTDAPESGAARLARLKRELRDLSRRFTDKYPDVIRVKQEIADLERTLAETTNHRNADQEPAALVDPSRRLLRTALRDTEVERKALKAEEEALRRQIADYRRRIDNTPRLEQELMDLSRTYATTKELHHSLLRRYEDAQLAGSMEHQQGEQFRILDPAIPPTMPAAPDRMRLLVFGVMLAAGMAAGAAVLAEHAHVVFHTVDDLRVFTKIPVLASIPLIVTRADVVRRRVRFGLGLVVALLGLALLVAAARYIAQGNEQLVWILSRGSS